MKFRSTWVMTILVACLAAYTFYEFKNSDDESGGDGVAKTHKIFSIERNELEEIQIDVKGVQTLLKRDGQSWRMVKPFEDLAEDAAVEGFVYTLLSQRGKEFLDEKDWSWEQFGLKPAKEIVEIRAKGKSEKLEVSTTNAFEGSFYIRVKDNLWLGDRGLAQLLEREPASFRSRKIYRGNEDVTTVQAELDFDGFKESYSFKVSEGKDGEVWTMSPDPGFPVDSSKVSQWVTKLVAAHGTDFVAGDVKRGKATFEAKMDDWVLSFTEGAGSDVIVSANKNPVIYKMSAAALDAVRVPRIFFRDGRVPFKFPVEQAHEIEIRTDKLSYTFVKKDQEWTLKNPKEGEELDPPKLIQLIQAVQNFEAAEFVSGGQGFPKDPQVTIKNSSGQILFSLSWGAEYKSKYSFNKSQNLRYVRVSTSKESLGLGKDKLDRLIDSAIIKKKVEAKPEPKK